MKKVAFSAKRNILRVLSVIIALFTLFSAVSLFSVNACAAGGVSAKTVRVAMDDSDLFISKDSSGKPVSGYAYEYIQNVAAYAGWKTEYVPCGGFAECVQAVTTGKADLFYDISYTEDREQLFLYPDSPMGTEDYYLFCLSGNKNIRSGDFSSYNGKTVGVTTDAVQVEALHNWCDEKGIKMVFREYVSIPEKEAALESGEIDLDYEISMLAKESYSALTKIAGGSYYLVTNTQRPDLLNDMNSARRKIDEVNPYFVVNLEQKYFAKSVLNRTLSRDELAWVNSHDVLKIGYPDNYLPFSSKKADGSPDGIIKDVVPVMLKNIGLDDRLPVEYIAFSGSEGMLSALKSGEIDAVFPIYDNVEFGADNSLSITSSIIDMAADLAYRGTYSDSTVAAIGVNRNNLLQEYYTRACYPDSAIVYYDTIDDALSAVAKGKVGSTVLNGLRTVSLLSDEAYIDLATVRLLKPFSFSFAVHPGNSSLLSILNRAILTLDEGFAQNYSLNYIKTDTDATFLRFIRANKFAIMSAAIAVLLIAGIVAVIVALTLEKSRKKLAEANEAKTRFLFNMSHDIRTPMNAILGFTEMADRNIHNPEKVADCHDKIRQSGNLLLSLINSVLEMSRIESGKAELIERPASVLQSFEGVESTMQDLARRKNIDLSFEFGEIQDKNIFVDMNLANRIFVNIISNAIKYTDYDGHVKVRCEQVGRQNEDCGLYRYTFEDNGIGMSEEFQKRVFDEFSRENTSTISGVQGSGLGMSVTKAFVDLMNGTIECQSKKGEGTTFTVTLPHRLQKNEDIEQIEQTPAIESAEVSPEIEEDAPASVAGKRVLLVEDNPLNREIAKFALEEMELIIEDADDGSTAVELLKEKGPQYYDLILMDIQMPIMDGLEATKVIRQMYPGAKIPIIAVSANAFAEDKAKSMAAGMDDHISKPLNPKDLLEAMSKFL